MTIDEQRNKHLIPTYENQLWHAKRLFAEKGMDALMNPHGHTGKMCGCGSCFCCAAWQVAREVRKERL